MRSGTATILGAAACVLATPAAAQSDRIDALEQQVTRQQQRIDELETLVRQQGALLERLGGTAASPPSAPSSGAGEPARLAAAPEPAPEARPMLADATPPLTGAAGISGLDIGGDVRVRQEVNFSDANARDRWRTVLRARARASYAVTPHISVGAQLVTGDPDDPNTTDVTLGSFVDDLDVSLDQAWIRYARGGLTLYAGKFPQLFARTDMVWDGDVSPQGVGAVQSTPLGGGKLDARAVYFVIDEASTARDSDMIGGQLVAAVPMTPAVKLSLAGSYYHYRLNAIAGADSGDFRSNLISGGHYLSDFHLLEGLGTIGWVGPSPHWPLNFTFDYVRNLGAAVPADSGFNAELAAGQTAHRGDWRIAYNYSEVGVDAVFAAFSHDNIALATNYRLHGLSVAYVPASDIVLDAAFYHYRPLDAVYAGAVAPHDWLNRLRLNLLVNF